MSSKGSKEASWLMDLFNFKGTRVTESCIIYHGNIINIEKIGLPVPRTKRYPRSATVGQIIVNGAVRAEIIHINYEKIVLNGTIASGDYCREVVTEDRRVTCQLGFTLIKREDHSPVEHLRHGTLVAIILPDNFTELYLYMLFAFPRDEGHVSGISSSICAAPRMNNAEDHGEFNDNVPVKLEPQDIKEELIVEVKDEFTPQDSAQDLLPPGKRGRDRSACIEEQPAPKRSCKNEQAETIIQHNVADAPQLLNEGPRPVPVPVEVFHSRTDATEASMANSPSNVSTSSNNSSGTGPKILCLIPLIEELEEAGLNTLAEELKILDNTRQNRTLPLHVGEFAESWPHVHVYLQKLEMIGGALRINKNTIHKVPTLESLLTTAATERIFNKLVLQWNAQPSPKSKRGRRHALQNFTRVFKKLYPTGDRDYFIDHGEPFPPPLNN